MQEHRFFVLRILRQVGCRSASEYGEKKGQSVWVDVRYCRSVGRKKRLLAVHQRDKLLIDLFSADNAEEPDYAFEVTFYERRRARVRRKFRFDDTLYVFGRYVELLKGEMIAEEDEMVWEPIMLSLLSITCCEMTTL